MQSTANVTDLGPDSSVLKMSITDYHAHAAIGKSSLDKINRSPAHYMASKLNPEPSTPAMMLGQAAHDFILQPDVYESLYVTGPDVHKNTNEWKAFVKENESKKIVSKDELLALQQMTNSVYTHPRAMELLSQGHPELSYFWKDPETGVDLKCRPDFNRNGHILVDLKTTEDASPKAFQKSVINFRYHVQAAHYLDGVSHVTGQKHNMFVLVVVEKKPPYAVAVYVFDDDAIDAGRFECRRNLLTYAECVAKQKWPGYSQNIETMALPHWYTLESI